MPDREYMLESKNMKTNLFYISLMVLNTANISKKVVSRMK